MIPMMQVHSKKHLDDVPELKAAKMETNRKTLVAMQRALNQVGAGPQCKLQYRQYEYSMLLCWGGQCTRHADHSSGEQSRKATDKG